VELFGKKKRKARELQGEIVGKLLKKEGRG
jgi:hypothetical protein